MRNTREGECENHYIVSYYLKTYATSTHVSEISVVHTNGPGSHLPRVVFSLHVLWIVLSFGCPQFSPYSDITKMWFVCREMDNIDRCN